MPDPMTEHDRTDDQTDLLSAEFSELARTMQAETSVRATLDTICKLILEVVPPAQHAGITVVKAGRFRTVASTSDLPPHIDAMQYRTGQGPCVDAILRHEVFRTGDLSREQRWPDFVRQATIEAGIHSMLSVRLFLQQDTLGALNLYSAERDAFTDHHRALGTTFAAHAAIAMQAAQQQEQLENLQQGLETARRIGAALGILMGRHRITEQQAMQLMIKASQHSNRKLRELAHDVIYTGELPR